MWSRPLSRAAPATPAALDYGPSFDQVNQINVVSLHDAGYHGEGVMIGWSNGMPARFFAQRQTGAALEGLFLAEPDGEQGVWEVMLKGARKVRPGERLLIKDRHKRDFCAEIF